MSQQNFKGEMTFSYWWAVPRRNKSELLNAECGTWNVVYSLVNVLHRVESNNSSYLQSTNSVLVTFPRSLPILIRFTSYNHPVKNGFHRPILQMRNNRGTERSSNFTQGHIAIE